MLVLALMLSVTFAAEAQGQGKKQSVTFNVLMHCNACKTKIEKEIGYAPGVSNIKIDLKQNTVTIAYNDAKTNIKTLSEAFKKIGYTAFPVGENCATKKGGCLNNAPTEINTMR